MLAAAALLPGCFYGFDNPIAQANDGVLLGDCSLSNPTAGQTVAGGTMSVLFSQLALPLDATGKFAFFNLPNGTYSLICQVPAPAASLFPLVAERPDVQLPRTLAALNQADSLDVGAVQIAASGIVGGVVTGATGSTVVAAYYPPASGSDAGLGGYETFSTTADPSTGAFQLALPPGNHVLAAADGTQSAIAPVTVLGGSTATQNLTLGATTAPASLDGTLVLDEPDLGASAAQGLLANYLPFIVYDLSTGPADAGTPILTAQPFLVDGGPTDGTFHIPIPSGYSQVNLTFEVTGGIGFPDAGFELSAFSLPSLPAIAGQSTPLLPQVTWLNNFDLAFNVAIEEDAGAIEPDDGGNSGNPGDGGLMMLSGGWNEIAGPYVPPSDFAGGAMEAFATGRGEAVCVVGLPEDGVGGGPGDLFCGVAQDGSISTWGQLTDSGGFFQSSLTGAETQGGDLLLSWGTTFADQGSYTGSYSVLFLRADGGSSEFATLPANLSPMISYFSQPLTVFPGTVGGVSGGLVVFPDSQGPILDALFVDPRQHPPTPTVVQLPLPDSGVTGAINVVGTSCNLMEFAGGSGFCLAATALDGLGSMHELLLGVATADGGLDVVSWADVGIPGNGSLFSAPSAAGLGIAQSDAGVLAIFDPRALGGDGNTYSTTLNVVGPFETLLTAPAQFNFISAPYSVTTVLPDPQGWLAIGGVTADSATGVGAMVFTFAGAANGWTANGGLVVLPTLPAANNGATVQAYRDPSTGLAVLPVQLDAGGPIDLVGLKAP